MAIKPLTTKQMHRLLEAFHKDFFGKTPDHPSTSVQLLDNGSPPVYKETMSSHLSSMIVVGPVKLNPNAKLIAKVLRAAKEVQQNVRKAIKDGSDYNLGDGYLDRDALEDVAAIDPGPALHELVRLWNNTDTHSDVNIREAKVKSTRIRIVVAGDTSYGDEPEGDGYRILQAAERLGMLPLLGLS